MSRKGETPLDPRDALIGSLDTGQTGCLVGRAATGARYRVYVMLGEILAAQSDEDDARLLARLVVGDLVEASQHEALRARVTKGGGLVESLFDVMPEQALLELLFERFRENLRAYLGAQQVEAFQAMDAVFTDNIQVGHDSRALVDELVASSVRVAALAAQPAMVLAPGAVPPQSERQRHLLVRCTDRIRLADLLDASGLEPGRTLEVAQDMLDRGMLVGLLPQARRRAEARTDPLSARSEPAPDAGPEPTPEAAAPPPEAAAPPPETPAPAPEAPAPAPEAPARRPSRKEAPAALPEPHSAPYALPKAADGAPRRSPLAADYIPDDPTVEDPRRGPVHPGVDEDEDLAAFQDYDTARGGGSFLTDRALLDRVDLEEQPAEVAALPPASSSELIEMEDAEQAGKDALKSAVSLNFSGPKLHDDEIQRKLGVTNDVLATIAEAIEAVEGRGAGQARLQLLVEGTSVPLAPLFKGVELSNDGRLPVALVIKNLRKRPAGEHRRLLNRALSDLIERALSAAYESLDEAGLEAMLERIAGYQQRLGV